MTTGRNTTFRADCILYNSISMPNAISYDGNISYVARKHNTVYIYWTGSYECEFGVFVDRSGWKDRKSVV